MELGVVSVTSILGMIFSGAISFIIPIVLMIYFIKKRKANLSYFFIGALIFFVFACVIEGTINSTVFSLGIISTDNILIYALYAAIMAATFEEVGRFIALKFINKDKLSTNNALLYGVGHGGFEAMCVVGFTAILNIISSISINSGLMENTIDNLDSMSTITLMSQLSVLWETPSYIFFLAGIERIFAIIAQVSFSIIIYLSVKYKKKRYFVIALMMHFILDFVSVMLTSMFSIIVLEFIICALSISILLIAYICYKKVKQNENIDEDVK